MRTNTSAIKKYVSQLKSTAQAMQSNNYMQTSSSGQTLLITLLVLTVTLTIGLSVIGRARTNIAITTEVEESAKAFNAAEAGVEEALRTGVGSGSVKTLSGSIASYNTNVSQVGVGSTRYAFPQLTRVNDTETLWLVEHTADDVIDETPFFTGVSVDVCWRGYEAIQPAMSVILHFKRGSTHHIARQLFDPDSGRRNNNKFADSGVKVTACGQSNVYKQTITFSNFGIQPTDTMLALRLRPFYADALIFADTGIAPLPSQGKLIISDGTTQTGITRKISVIQPYRSAPSIFDAAVVSQGSFAL